MIVQYLERWLRLSGIGGQQEHDGADNRSRSWKSASVSFHNRSAPMQVSDNANSTSKDMELLILHQSEAFCKRNFRKIGPDPLPGAEVMSAIASLAFRLRSRPSPGTGTTIVEISQHQWVLNKLIHPTDASVHDSSATSRWQVQDSRSGQIATPFPCGSFIPRYMPVYRGASALH
jgi:hypothetical protein